MPRVSGLSEVNDLHIPVVTELRKWIKPEWRFFHCPNGEWRAPRAAAKLKAMGVLPGVPDLILLGPRTYTTKHIYFLEFKLPGGKLSDAQEDFRVWAICRGSPYVVAYSQSEAFQAFNEWGCWSITKEMMRHA